MYKIHLSVKEQKALRERKKKEKDSKIFRRLQCIDMKNMGESHEKIARLLEISIETISHWLKLYSEKGLDGLCSLRYDGRRPSKLDKHRKEIREHLRKGKTKKITELQDYIAKTWHISIEESWLFRYCKKNSLFPIKRPA